MKNKSALSVGELARRGCVKVETIRFYESRGLLASPPRTAAGYRAFPEEAVKRLHFIRRAKDLGFTLKEIKELLELKIAGGTRCSDVLRHAERKAEDIESKMRHLRQMRRALLNLTKQCQGHLPASECPILEAMDEKIGS